MHITRPGITGLSGKQPPWGNWLLFYGSVFFFMTNLFAAIALFPAYSLSIGSTTFQAGLQNTVFALTAVLLRVFLGPVMDRKGPKQLMLLGISSFMVAPLLLLLNPVYSMLLTARMIQSLGLAVVLPGISTLVADMAPPNRIGTYLGSARIFFNLALLTGPAGALLVIEAYGYSYWLAISAITSTISLLLLFSVTAPAVHHKDEVFASSREQIIKAMAEKQVIPIIISIAVFSFTYSAVISFAAVYIESVTPGAGAAFFFVLLGFSGIIACLGAGFLSDRYGRQRVAWPALIMLGSGAILFSFISAWPALTIISAVVLGLGIQSSTLVFAAWLIDLSKPGLRATTISIQENTIDSFFALGSLTFGLAAQGPGLGAAFLSAGILTILSVLPLSRKFNLPGDRQVH